MFSFKLLKSAVNYYINNILINKNKKTYYNDKSTILKFYEYFSAKKYFFLSSIAEKQIIEYQNYLLVTKKIKRQTVNRHTRAIKSFFNFAFKLKWVSHVPKFDSFAEDVKGTRRIWTDYEFKEVLKLAPKELQNALIIARKTAIRPSELIELTWDDCDIENHTITVRSRKGGRGQMERIIPLVNEAYIKLIDQSLTRKSHKVFNISLQCFQRKLRDIAMLLKFPNLTLYGLRHTTLTRLAEQDVSIEKIRIIAGHSQIKTTQGYFHVNQRHIKNALEKI